MDIYELLKHKAAIRLDIGCGEVKQSPDWFGIDIRDIPGIDLVWDVNKHPWPLPDECASVAVCSHLVEHIPPVMFREDGPPWFPFIEFMNEVWRVMKYDGEFAIACPHGSSQLYLQDPTHCNPCNETTWAYFDPLESKSGGMLFRFYKPKPWRIKALSYDPSANIEVVLVKRREDKSYYG
jgi:hypothetical protein